MTLPLTNARARALYLLGDDVGGDLYNQDGTFSGVDASLSTAQLEVAQLAASCSNLFVLEGAATTTTAGVADLTSLGILELISVAQGDGTAASLSRFDIPAVSPFAPRVYNTPVSIPLIVRYKALPTFPANGAALFVWGSASTTATALLDQLLVLKAASELKARENETNAVVERRIAQLTDAIKATMSQPSSTTLPQDMSGTGYRPSSSYAYRYNSPLPQQLQLVQAR
jgi:hypothetical protein